MDKYSLVKQTPTTIALTSRLTLLVFWRIVWGAMIEGENVEVEREGNGR